MQSDQVKHAYPHNQKGEEIMQGEEAIESWIINGKTTPQPMDNAVSKGNSGKDFENIR